MTNKFISIMEAIGRDALKGLDYIKSYLPKVAELIEEIFPKETRVVDGIVNAVGLIQDAVVTIEQKYKAANISGNGVDKAADVLSLVTPTVTQLLTAEGITVDAGYIQNLSDAVVAILKVRESTVSVSA